MTLEALIADFLKRRGWKVVEHHEKWQILEKYIGARGMVRKAPLQALKHELNGIDGPELDINLFAHWRTDEEDAEKAGVWVEGVSR